jgi:hypothetical protein
MTEPRCPRCDGALERYGPDRRGGVRADVCGRHGLWIEEHALRRAVETAHRRPADVAEARRRAASITSSITSSIRGSLTRSLARGRSGRDDPRDDCFTWLAG